VRDWVYKFTLITGTFVDFYLGEPLDMVGITGRLIGALLVII
jgi:hypothetical protein